MPKFYSILFLIALSYCGSDSSTSHQTTPKAKLSFESCLFVGYKDQLPVFSCENENQDAQTLCIYNEAGSLVPLKDFSKEVEILTVKEDVVFYYDIDSNVLIGENGNKKILSVKTLSRVWSAVFDNVNEVLYYSDDGNRIKMRVLGQGGGEEKELSVKGTVFGFRDHHLYYYANVGDRPFINIHELNIKTGKVKDLFLDSSSEAVLFEDEIMLLPNKPYISCRGRLDGSIVQVLFNIDSRSICRVGEEDDLENLFTYYDRTKNKLVCYNPEDLSDPYYFDLDCK